MKMLSIMFVTVLSCPGMAFAGNDPLREQFNKLDDNNDGMLTRAELQAKPELIRYSNFYSLGSFFLADINKDNQIDFREFEAQEEEIPY
ncbi:MAG: hypothetical protein PVG75_10400 [Thioalkalispiraceae bacterium]|jgi:Ca2+-binding EF-hand superfamily protein